eukprot:TRINITY_DN10255_c0_g1_i1.p1 TRINITY_DN10255_c0_g1~~TRINITY_DN10255_c0_g1_i1.p1  ORF type:complete len:489 (+),score=134.21 TRINITY_DN10255_c0_g1_i1:205-1671(+)
MSVRRRLTEPQTQSPNNNNNDTDTDTDTDTIGSSTRSNSYPFVYDNISNDDSSAQGVYSPLSATISEEEEEVKGSGYVGDLLQFPNDNVGADLTLTIDTTASYQPLSLNNTNNNHNNGKQSKVLSPPSSPSSRGGRNHATTTTAATTTKPTISSNLSTASSNTKPTNPTIPTSALTSAKPIPPITLNRTLSSPATQATSQTRAINQNNSSTTTTTTTATSSSKSLSTGNLPKQPPPINNDKSFLHSTTSSKKRKSQTAEEAKADSTKKKKMNRESEKTKGLRLFSLKVCEKVEQKRRTTYNEVADEVVDEVCKGMIEIESTSKNVSTEHKNIRRRVYDALNVLRAMGIISKEKKEIRWIGLPSSASPRKLTSSPLYDVDSLEIEKQSRLERIRKKKELYNDLLTQKNAYTNLIARNVAEPATTDARLYVPFILVNTKNQTVIECEMAEDRTEYFFNFSQPFELHDDCHILSLMGLANTDNPNIPLSPS